MNMVKRKRRKEASFPMSKSHYKTAIGLNLIEDAKAGIVRERKKRNFFEQVFGYWCEDEARIVAKNRDGMGKDDVVR